MPPDDSGLTLGPEAAELVLPPPRPHFRWLTWIVGACAIALAVFLLQRVLRRYSLDELIAAVEAIPASRIAGAAATAAASYAMLTLFDFFAVRYTGNKLAWRRAALASFTALSIGHNIGLAALSSGALRYRFYRSWGIGRGDIARIILFCAATSALGLITLTGIALLVEPELATGPLGIGMLPVRAIGAIALAGVALYLGAAAWLRPTLQLGRWRVEMPKLRLALVQIALGLVNFLFVTATLYQVVAATSGIGFLRLAGTYTIANLLSVVAHVPGGWGVLEAAVVLAVPDADPIGAILVFRLVYFLAPLMLGLATLLLAEGARQLRSRSRTGAPATPSRG